MNQDKRQQVLERDEFECQFCEMTNEEHKEKYGRGIEVHHVVPRKADGSDKKNNLLTVCRSCHSTLEKTQGNLLKRLYKNDKEEELEELRKTNERLKDELEDRYTFDEIIQESRKARAKIYLVVKYPLFGEKPSYKYVGPSREEALEEMEEYDNVNLKKWNITVDLSQILKDKESRLAERIERRKSKR